MRWGSRVRSRSNRRSRQRGRGRRERLEHHRIERGGPGRRGRACGHGVGVEGAQRLRTQARQSPQHRERRCACGIAPLAVRRGRRARTARLARGEHDGHLRVAVARAVHAPQTLNHRIEGGEVHHRVVGVEVDADLSGRGRHQVHRGCIRRGSLSVREPPPHGPIGEHGPLVSAQRPGEHGDPLRGIGPERRDESAGDAPRIGHALDEHHDRAGAVRKGRGADAPDALCRGRRLDEARGLARVQPPAYRGASEVGIGESEHRRARSAGRRQRHGAELGTALEPCDVTQQRGERRRQVRLVEQHHRVVSEQPRVHRTARAPVAVAREQQPRAHHVDGAVARQRLRCVAHHRDLLGGSLCGDEHQLARSCLSSLNACSISVRRM